MASHHVSFTDYLSLYLPHFLRPSLPRDLRAPQQVQQIPLRERRDIIPSTPPPTPERSGSQDEGPGTVGTSRGTSLDDEEEKEERRKKKKKKLVRDEEKGKSREGYHVSLILTNSGSVARDHLASERTFLAYVRTSLALASTGVALVQLFTIANNTMALQHGTTQQRLIRHFATPVGSTLILLGLAVLLIGCQRYFAIQTALTRGVFPAARLTVIFVVVMLGVITGLIFGVLVRGRSSK